MWVREGSIDYPVSLRAHTSARTRTHARTCHSSPSTSEGRPSIKSCAPTLVTTQPRALAALIARLLFSTCYPFMYMYVYV